MNSSINRTRQNYHNKLKLYSLALLLSLTPVLTASPIFAQGPAIPFKPKIYVGAGYAPIVSPDTRFKDIFNSTISLQAAVGIPLSSGFELVGKVQYHNFSSRYEGFPELGVLDAAFFSSLGLEDPDRTITTIGLDAKLPFGPSLLPIRPYFLVGGGSFTLKQNEVIESITIGNPPQNFAIGYSHVNRTDIYFNLGFGADIKIGPTLGLFIEGKYTVLNTPMESAGLTPIIVGLRLF
ncbi:hypothetical protein JYU19_00980 [bacterium AH-315-J21]|nr:hypothetical protein [bacterium AH-315-J21]